MCESESKKEKKWAQLLRTQKEEFFCISYSVWDLQEKGFSSYLFDDNFLFRSRAVLCVDDWIFRCSKESFQVWAVQQRRGEGGSAFKCDLCQKRSSVDFAKFSCDPCDFLNRQKLQS